MEETAALGSGEDAPVATVLASLRGVDGEMQRDVVEVMDALAKPISSRKGVESRPEARLRRRTSVEHALLTSLPKTSKKGSGEVRACEER